MRAWGGPAQDRLELARRLLAGEAWKLEPPDRPHPLPPRPERPQRMGPVNLVRAEGEDQQDAHPSQAADQERDEVERRAIGPLEVLNREHQGPVCCQPLDEAEHDASTSAPRPTNTGLTQTRLHLWALWQRGKRRAEQRVLPLREAVAC